mgnify:CR=1 FL=1
MKSKSEIYEFVKENPGEYNINEVISKLCPDVYCKCCGSKLKEDKYRAIHAEIIRMMNEKYLNTDVDWKVVPGRNEL